MVTRLTSAMWCWPDAKRLLVAAYCFWIVSGCACACLLVSWLLFHALGSSLTDAGVLTSACLWYIPVQQRAFSGLITRKRQPRGISEAPVQNANEQESTATAVAGPVAACYILLLRSNPPSNGGDQATSKQTDAVNQLKSFQRDLLDSTSPVELPEDGCVLAAVSGEMGYSIMTWASLRRLHT